MKVKDVFWLPYRLRQIFSQTHLVFQMREGEGSQNCRTFLFAISISISILFCFLKWMIEDSGFFDDYHENDCFEKGNGKLF